MHSSPLLLTPSNRLNFLHPKSQSTALESVTCEAAQKEKFVIARFKSFLICVEDRRFYKHPGLDFRGIIRAVLENLKSKKIVQGGSTITQQLARRILNDNRKSFFRKIRESWLALQLELRYQKDDILDYYLENIYWGGKLYGIQAASRNYFNKVVSDLNLDETIILIALLRGPNLYLKNPDLLSKRCCTIQNTLNKSGKLNAADNQSLNFKSIKFTSASINRL